MTYQMRLITDNWTVSDSCLFELFVQFDYSLTSNLCACLHDHIAHTLHPCICTWLFTKTAVHLLSSLWAFVTYHVWPFSQGTGVQKCVHTVRALWHFFDFPLLPSDFTTKWRALKIVRRLELVHIMVLDVATGTPSCMPIVRRCLPVGKYIRHNHTCIHT